MAKTAIILFNLGGPDAPASVQPFLFNLFHDPAIIGVPQPFRWLLAKLISSRRAPIARHIYEQIGGSSPLLEQTKAQAKALEQQLGDGHKVFIAMRYWHPLTQETVEEVKHYAPDRIILLPLYPQFSTTTTGSSLKEWQREAKRQNVEIPTTTIACYPAQPQFIEAHADLLKRHYREGMRVLFSAHGLPKKVIAAGDPYQYQVEQTAAAIVNTSGIMEMDWHVCYQSRVGPLEWIGPATDDEIRRAGKEQKPLLIVPIAFVSEHSETLVELDKEYATLAIEAGVPSYHRVPTLQTEPLFIEALAALCKNPEAAGDKGMCALNFSQCACKLNN